MKKYLIILTITIGVLSCTSRQKAAPQQETTVRQSVIVPADLIGKTIEYQYGPSIYHVTIDSETDMHWEAMAGDEKGTYEEENYKIESIDSQKLFITWGEANGIGVSQVLDFEKGVVYNHLLRGRDISTGRGTIKILE